MNIRPATPNDLPAINDIYNHYVLHSTATYQTTPETLEARQQWFHNHGPDHPIIVAESNNTVLGWGSLSPFHPRAAYARTVENSVYVHPNHHRQGIGQTILQHLIDQARALNHHTIIALIDASQPASIALHTKFNFTKAAHLKEVGNKFNQWLDVVFMQLML